MPHSLVLACHTVCHIFVLPCWLASIQLAPPVSKIRAVVQRTWCMHGSLKLKNKSLVVLPCVLVGVRRRHGLTSLPNAFIADQPHLSSSKNSKGHETSQKKGVRSIHWQSQHCSIFINICQSALRSSFGAFHANGPFSNFGWTVSDHCFCRSMNKKCSDTCRPAKCHFLLATLMLWLHRQSCMMWVMGKGSDVWMNDCSKGKCQSAAGNLPLHHRFLQLGSWDKAVLIQNTSEDNGASTHPRSALLLDFASNNACCGCSGVSTDWQTVVIRLMWGLALPSLCCAPPPSPHGHPDVHPMVHWIACPSFSIPCQFSFSVGHFSLTFTFANPINLSWLAC